MFLTVPRCHGVCGFNPCLVEQRAWRFPACMGLGQHGADGLAGFTREGGTLAGETAP